METIINYLADFGFVLGVVSLVFIPVAIIIGLVEHFTTEEQRAAFIEKIFNADENADS